MSSWELYEKRTTGEGEVVVTLYDNGHATIWNEASVDCSVDVADLEELKELAEIFNSMIRDIERPKKNKKMLTIKYDINGCSEGCPRLKKEGVKMVSDQMKNKYHFNFTIGMNDTMSEEEQESLSKHLLDQVRGWLFTHSFHIPSLDIDNEFHLEENEFVPPDKKD